VSPAARAALEALAAQAAIAIENARLYKEGLEKARLDQELGMASRIQQALLPESRRSGTFFEIVGASIPSRAIGGDFFDYQQFADGRFGFGIGDITGHGPAAALVTALVQGVLATCALSVSGPDETVALVNRVLFSRRIESKYLTLFLAALSPDGRLTYCNAGHNPPLLFTCGTREVHRLETGGTILGAFPAPKYERDGVQMAAGDTLVLYSDGVTEALNASGDEFEETRVRDVVEQSLDEPIDRILAALLDAVRRFAGQTTPHDDLTAVVLRYRK
jgi:sigma-B regulation protein RsbU (phosphoserine phosphatase)